MVSDRPAPVAAALDAATLATVVLAQAGVKAEAFRVIAIENLLKGREASAVMWRVTFKLAEVIPAGRTGKIGKGGEHVVEVDTERRSGRLV